MEEAYVTVCLPTFFKFPLKRGLYDDNFDLRCIVQWNAYNQEIQNIHLFLFLCPFFPIKAGVQVKLNAILRSLKKG